MIGTKFAEFEITGHLGSGGMGDVYQATDSKLGRRVAVKFLPEAFARDADRVARFEREARVLASLNHPNIAAIYGLEDSNDKKFLVMELVDGETLAGRINRGPLPIDEALNIAKSICEALEAAHEKGLVHRDLKPANVKITPDGKVKVLDFGLAKALDSGPANAALPNSPTLSMAATNAGVILGTAAYMSPEQAKGRAVDKRTDIFAFGCVLYEMLNGRPAFEGEDVAEILSRVLQREPDWNLLPTSVPQGIKKLLRLCLEKDVKKRRSDAADVRIDIEQALREPTEIAALSATSPTTKPRASRRRIIAIASAAFFTATVLTAFVGWIALRPSAQPVVRFTATPLGPLRLANTIAPDPDLAISADGHHIVYAMGDQQSTQRLYVRTLDQLDATALPGIVGARGPFISPDGKWIGFFDVLGLKKVAINGGPALTLCNIVDGSPMGASWGSDDRITFATNAGASGLQRVSAGGGTPEILTKPDPQKGEADHLFPEVLPGGRAVLFTIWPLSGPIEAAQIAVLNLATGERKVLIQGGTNPHYAASGHIVYAFAGTLRAVAFDPDRLEVRSDPVPVADHVMIKTSGAADFTVSNNGSLAYVAGGSAAGAMNTLVWVDRQGHEEPIAVPPRAYTHVRISPNGTRVALDIRDQDSDIWVWDFMRRTLTRLTFDPGLNRNPAWSPDGRRLAFSALREGSDNVYWQAADGSGAAERLTRGAKAETPTSILPDGKRLLFHAPNASPRDISIVNLDGEHRTELLLHTPFDEYNASVSPDGRWLAYESNESGRYEVYVRPFPDINGGRWQISVSGGTRPVWARNGRELFYLVPPGKVMAVPVQPGSSFTAGNPQMLFDGPYLAPNVASTYDVSPDGKRFLMIKEAQPAAAASTPPQLVVVLNWFEELKRLTWK